jgi:hypothetical protein
MAWLRKIKAGLAKYDVDTFVGHNGQMFFDIETGSLRLSDGSTPGGIHVSTGGGGGATTFSQLSDTPNSFTNCGGYYVKVKTDASGLEFVNECSLSVATVDTNNNIICNNTNINSIYFDTDSGFDVQSTQAGVVKVQMNSTFKTWKSSGEPDLVATGLDTIEFVSGTGIDITFNPNGNPDQTLTIANTITNLTDLGISDGTEGQVLTTNGCGSFSFTTVSSGGTDTNIDGGSPGSIYSLNNIDGGSP